MTRYQERTIRIITDNTDPTIIGITSSSGFGGGFVVTSSKDNTENFSLRKIGFLMEIQTLFF